MVLNVEMSFFGGAKYYRTRVVLAWDGKRPTSTNTNGSRLTRGALELTQGVFSVTIGVVLECDALLCRYLCEDTYVRW